MSMESCVRALSCDVVGVSTSVRNRASRCISLCTAAAASKSRRLRTPGSACSRLQPVEISFKTRRLHVSSRASSDAESHSPWKELARTAAVFLSSSAFLLAAGMKVCRPAFAEGEAAAAAAAAAALAAATSVTLEETAVKMDAAERSVENSVENTKDATENTTDAAETSVKNTTAVAAETSVETNTTDAAETSNSNADSTGAEQDRSQTRVVELKPLSQEEEDEMLEQLDKLHVSMESRDMSTAIGLLDKLIEKTPEVLEFRFIRGHALEYMGELAKARSDFEYVLEVDPMSLRAVQGLALVLRKEGKDITHIVKDVEDATKQAYEDKRLRDARDLRMLLGQLFTLKEDLPKALQVYADLSKDDPTDFRPHLCQGLVRCIIGELEQAEKHFAEFQKHCPPKLDCKEMLDELVARAKQEAADYFKKPDVASSSRQ